MNHIIIRRSEPLSCSEFILTKRWMNWWLNEWVNQPVIVAFYVVAASDKDRHPTHAFHVTKLSVTSRGLLVTSSPPPSLREYSTTDRQLLRVVQLPGYVAYLSHGVETTRGTFIIGHDGTSQDKRQYAVSELINDLSRISNSNNDIAGWTVVQALC